MNAAQIRALLAKAIETGYAAEDLKELGEAIRVEIERLPPLPNASQDAYELAVRMDDVSDPNIGLSLLLPDHADIVFFVTPDNEK